MAQMLSFSAARDLLLSFAIPVSSESVPLSEAPGRILAQDVYATQNVPPFDRSAYDGYALYAADTLCATPDSPVTLPVSQEITPGFFQDFQLRRGSAAKIFTGAPIPHGADAIVKFESTCFTDASVTIFSPCHSHSNIVNAGEDVSCGTLLAASGTAIDAGLAGTLASQNIAYPNVYRIPTVGILSTGNELSEVGRPLLPGKIHDANAYALSAALLKIGCKPLFLGCARDCSEEICAHITRGLDICDALLISGGVSVGDYDLTPEAMRKSGVELLFCGISIKPGKACAYGQKCGKLVCALSGNPASAITNFYAVAASALRKLCGQAAPLPKSVSMVLSDDFAKKQSHHQTSARQTGSIRHFFANPSIRQPGKCRT